MTNKSVKKSVKKVKITPLHSVIRNAVLMTVPAACINPPSTQSEHDLLYDIWFLIRYPGSPLKPEGGCLERAVNRAILAEMQRRRFLPSQDQDPNLAILTAADVWDVIANIPQLVDMIRMQDTPDFLRFAKMSAAQATSILLGHETTSEAPPHVAAASGGATQSSTASSGRDDATLRDWFNALQRIMSHMTSADRATIASTFDPRMARDILRALALRQTTSDGGDNPHDASELFDDDAVERLYQAADAIRAHDTSAAQRIEQLARAVEAITGALSDDLRRILSSLAVDDHALAMVAAALIADPERFKSALQQPSPSDVNEPALQAFHAAARHALNQTNNNADDHASDRLSVLNHLLAQPEGEVIDRMREAREALQRIRDDSLQRAVDALRRMGLSDGAPGDTPDDHAIRQAARALRGDTSAVPKERADEVAHAMQSIRMDAVRAALDALRRANLIPDASPSSDKHGEIGSGDIQTLSDMQHLLDMASERPEELAAALREAREALQRIRDDSLQRAVDALRRMGLSDGAPGDTPDDHAIRQAARALRGDTSAVPKERADEVAHAMQSIRMDAVRAALDALNRALKIDDMTRLSGDETNEQTLDLLTYDALAHRLVGSDSALSEDDARAIYDAIQEALEQAHAHASDAVQTMMHALEQRGYAADDDMRATAQSLLETRMRLCDRMHCDPGADIERLTQEIHHDAIRRIIDEQRRHAGETPTDAMPISDEEIQRAHEMLESLFDPAGAEADMHPDDQSWIRKTIRVLQTIMASQSSGGTSKGTRGIPGDASDGVSFSPASDSGNAAQGGGNAPSTSGDRSTYELAEQLATIDVDIDFEQLPGAALSAPDTDSPYADIFNQMLEDADSRTHDRPLPEHDDEMPTDDREPLEDPQSALHPGRLRSPEPLSEEAIATLQDTLNTIVQQVNNIIAQELTQDQIDAALEGTIGVASVLSDFGIEEGELRAAPIDQIVALATMINQAGSHLHAMLVSFGSVNSVLQHTDPGDPAQRNPFGMPEIGPTDDIFSILGFDPSVITSNPAYNAYRARELMGGTLLGFVPPPDKTARGPLVCAVDDSGSMDGHPRIVAHAIALAMAAEAIRERRAVTLIKFSGPEDALILYQYPDPEHAGESRLEATHRLLNWASSMIGGGTDFDRPLGKILRVAEESELNGCDAVFITDGGASISHLVVAQWEATCEERDLGLLAFVIGGGTEGVQNIQKVATDIYSFPAGSFTIGNRDQIAHIVAAFLQSRRDGGLRHAGAVRRSDQRKSEILKR